MNPSEKIDHYIADLPDWRGPLLAQIRDLFHEVNPAITEEWKWMGTPCWYHDGLIAAGMAFKTKVKIGFINGAHLSDPDHVFNGELKGNKRRSVEFFEGDTVDAKKMKRLIQAALDFNLKRTQNKK